MSDRFKTVLKWSVVFIFAVAIGQMVWDSVSTEVNKDLGTANAYTDFELFWDKFNPEETTEVKRKKRWKKFKNKCVAWTGKIYEVQDGGDVYKIYFKHLDSTLSHDVAYVIPKEKKDLLPSLKKGDEVTYPGYLERYGEDVLSTKVRYSDSCIKGEDDN